MAKKMVALNINETSGVDHPAHMHEGWMVIKSAPASADGVLAAALKSEEDLLMKTDAELLADSEAALAKALAENAEMKKHFGPDGKPVVKPAEGDEPVDKTAEFLKSAPAEVVEMFTKMQADNAESLRKAAETDEILRKERIERLDTEAVAKATASYGELTGLDFTVLGKSLRALGDTDPELAKSIETALAAANAQVESAGIFSELGKSGNLKAGEQVLGNAEALAKSAREADPSLTAEQALNKVFQDDPTLYDDYLNSQKAQA